MINLDFSLVITIFYILVLYAFMSRYFFEPITKILHERRQLIEGREEVAQQRLAEVDRKAAEYDNALKAARAEAYRHQEAFRERALADRAQIVMKAKQQSEKTLQETRERLLAQAEAAKKELEAEAGVLARELSAALLRDKS